MPQLYRAARAVGRALLFTGILVALLAATALLTTVSLAYLRGQTWQDNIYLGAICSLITWLFVAVFHWRTETISLPFQNRNEFLVDVRAVMQELGYEVHSQSADLAVLRFRPRLRSLLFGGGARLMIEGQAARISGPRVCLEVLRNRLRVRHHVDRMQQTMLENSRLLDDSIHQRVQVGLRLSPEQLQRVLDEVINVLADEGDVVCYLKILARNDSGIPQSTIDGRIRAWLKGNGIAAEIQKDHVKREAAVTS